MKKIILFIGIILLSISIAKDKYPPIEIPEEFQQFIEPNTVPIIFDTIPMDDNQEAKLLVLQNILEKNWWFDQPGQRVLLILQKDNGKWAINTRNDTEAIRCINCGDLMFGDPLQNITIKQNSIIINFEGSRWMDTLEFKYNYDKKEWFVYRLEVNVYENLLCNNKSCTYPKDLRYISVNDFVFFDLFEKKRKYIHKN